MIAFLMKGLIGGFIVAGLSSACRAGDMREALFVDNWKFQKGDNAGASSRGFDDSSWRKLDLPHDWSVEEAFDPNLAACTAFLPCGVAWYRKTFTLPADAVGKSVRVRFDGVMNHSTVYCNGKIVGGRPYGYSSFTCDLSSMVRFDQANVIAVRVDHSQYADSRWYAGSGIYRDVFLIVTDKVHVDTDGTFLSVQRVSADSARMQVQTTVRNDDLRDSAMELVTSILDDNGRILATTTQSAAIPSMGDRVFDSVLELSHPALWSVDRPNMYRALAQVKREGQIVDEYVTPFGVRTFAFDPEKGFLLNGVRMKLKGVCLHHDAGVLGAAVPIEVWGRRLRLLKEAGCNAIRTSHNPPSPAFLDLCDRMGFVVMDEAFDEWSRGKKKWIEGHDVGKPGFDGYHTDFAAWSDTDIRDMVKRDRDHPSIIMWSIGNEIDYTGDPYPPNCIELPPIARRLIADVKDLDRTRPVTAACAFPGTNLYKGLLDIEGYNYMEKRYASDHAAHPDRVIFGSENSHRPDTWEAVANNEFIAGQFLWTGVDYMGEAAPWPSHGSPSGLLNTAGFPKNNYYYRQTLWVDRPVVHLSTTDWRPTTRGWTGTRPDEPTVYCLTNCDGVELFHDGKSLGVRSHQPWQVLTWPFKFTGGELTAVGRRGGESVTFTLKKSGAAAKLVAIPDVTSLQADGRSVAQIEVDVTDERGTRVFLGTNEISCSITGPGKILGIDNGDLRDNSDLSAKKRKTHDGRVMVYVQALREAGSIQIRFNSPGLSPVSVALRAVAD